MGAAPTRVVKRARQVGPALVDQVLSSGTQLFAAIFIARVSSAELFGVASAMLLLHGLAMGSVRAVVGDIVLLRCRRPGADARREARLGLLLAGSIGLLIGAAIAVAAAVASGDLRDLLLVLAVVLPFGVCQDLQRSVAYGRRRVVDAVWLDGTWMVVQLVVSAALFASDRATADSLLLAWGLGAVVSATGGCLVQRLVPSTRGARAWMAEDGRRSVSFLADYAVNSGVLIVADLSLGFILPPAQFGALRLARLALNPLVNLIAGVRALLLGRLAEIGDDRAEVRRVAVGVGRLFALAMTLYGGFMALLPTNLGEVLFGSEWGGARGYVGVMVLSEVFAFSMLPAVDVVRVLGSPSQLVRTRTWTSGVLAVANVALGAAFGATGVVWGWLVVRSASAYVWWRLALRLARPRFDEPVGSADG